MPAETVAPSLRAWRRDQRLRALGYADYTEYLSSPCWRAMRARYRASGLPQDCQLCGAAEKIVLHHRTYERIASEELADLIPLCLICHDDVHSLDGEHVLVGRPEDLIDPARASENRTADRERRERVLADHVDALPSPLDDARRLLRLELEAEAIGLNLDMPIRGVRRRLDEMERKIRRAQRLK